MSLGRLFHGVPDSYKHLNKYWHGDMEKGFPARINAMREDGVSMWYLPSDEVKHDRDKARAREERLVMLIHDMFRALEAEDKRHRLHGLHEKLGEFELRMEALGIEVE